MKTVEHIDQLPNLGKESIHIWGIQVSAFVDRLESLKHVLCAEEVAKADRFHRAADRSSSIIARGSLRVLLSGYTGIPAADIRFQYLETGKPHVDDSDIDFNLSHSGEWVVLAIGRNRNIGVDIEMIKREMDVMAIASRYFTPQETALIQKSDDPHMLFFNLWARKEGYVKACGSALFRELRSFTVPKEDGEKEGWFFQSLEAGSKYAAAVVTDKPIVDMPCFDFGGMKWDS